MDKGSQYDPTDAAARGPLKITAPQKTMEGGYNMPGLPTPPAGYGKTTTPGPMPGGCM